MERYWQESTSINLPNGYYVGETTSLWFSEEKLWAVFRNRQLWCLENRRDCPTWRLVLNNV